MCPMFSKCEMSFPNAFTREGKQKKRKEKKGWNGFLKDGFLNGSLRLNFG